MFRGWINQPSIRDSLYHLHGTNVLVAKDHGDNYQIYFLSGPVISMSIPKSVISRGWK